MYDILRLYVYHDGVRVGMAESADSLQWMPAFDNLGEFKLVCAATETNRALLVMDAVLYNPDTPGLAAVVLAVEADGDNHRMTVRGKFSLCLFKRRTARGSRTITDGAAGLLEVRTGTASASPALPELRRDDDYDEIFLYRVTRPRGATKISADNIVDLRLDSTYCGLMRDTMDSVDTGVMNAAFTAFLQQIEAELAQLHAGTAVMTKGEYDPAGLSLDAAVQLYSCTKSGKVYALKGTGAVGRFKVPAAWSAGDTWTVNGKAIPAYCGADAADGDSVVAGRWVLFTFDGSRLDFNGGGGLSASKLAQATAADTDVLTGKKYYAGGKTIKEGKMPNRDSWGTTIAPGGAVTVPEGYHNGEGRVKAATWTKDKYLYLVIQYQGGYGNPIPEYAATVVAQGIPEPGFLAHYSGPGNSGAVTNVCNANMLNIGAYAGNGTAQITPLTYLYDIFHKTNHDPGVVYTLGAGVYCYRMR